MSFDENGIGMRLKCSETQGKHQGLNERIARAEVILKQACMMAKVAAEPRTLYGIDVSTSYGAEMSAMSDGPVHWVRLHFRSAGAEVTRRHTISDLTGAWETALIVWAKACVMDATHELLLALNPVKESRSIRCEICHTPWVTLVDDGEVFELGCPQCTAHPTSGRAHRLGRSWMMYALPWLAGGG